MNACAHPLPWAVLVDYWAGELTAAETEQVDEHLFGCAACTAASARVAAVTEAVRKLLPPVVSRGRLDSLRAGGLRVRENDFSPGERRAVTFDAGLDLLVHRLGGIDLSGADHVSLQVVVESTGERLLALDRVPFERGEGAVLIACQRHFSSLPADTRFEVAVHSAAPDSAVTNVAYTILHQFPA